MVESRGGSRLLLKTPNSPIVPSKFGAQQFDGDVSAKPRVLGQIDLAHPAGANGSNYPIRAKRFPTAKLRELARQRRGSHFGWSGLDEARTIGGLLQAR